jgi:short-subunit dehydrogenase
MSVGKALITGASSGIGATYAHRLAERGYDLVLVARDGVRLNELGDVLRSKWSVEVEVVAADLTLEADLSEIETRLASGDISLFLNNAGKALHGSLLDNGPVELSGIVALNVTAALRLSSAAGKSFAKRGSGTIVNIASVLALVPEIMDGVYSATKAFILNLSQSMAVQLKDAGVHVQVVLPGATRTEIWERAGNDVNALPPEMVMDVNDLVDAALVGLDRKEFVTIPPLHDEGRFQAMTESRLSMAPHLSTSEPAPRYLKDA